MTGSCLRGREINDKRKETKSNKFFFKNNKEEIPRSVVIQKRNRGQLQLMAQSAAGVFLFLFLHPQLLHLAFFTLGRVATLNKVKGEAKEWSKKEDQHANRKPKALLSFRQSNFLPFFFRNRQKGQSLI